MSCKKSCSVIFSLFLTLSIAGCCHAPGEKPHLTLKKEKGELVFETTFYEFGKVTEGDVITRTFPFKNTGPGPVKVVKAVTSCGCTTAKGAFKEYAPGEEGVLEITVDTKGKRGVMVKTTKLFLENGVKEIQELTLMAELVQPPHPDIENVLDVTKDPQCRTCHLEAAVGQTGVFLYHKICFQCHGKKGKGGMGGALNQKEWQSRVTDDYLVKSIEKGIPESGMPPYAKGVEPALTKGQVISLVKYLRSLKK